VLGRSNTVASLGVRFDATSPEEWKAAKSILNVPLEVPVARISLSGIVPIKNASDEVSAALRPCIEVAMEGTGLEPEALEPWTQLATDLVDNAPSVSQLDALAKRALWELAIAGRSDFDDLAHGGPSSDLARKARQAPSNDLFVRGVDAILGWQNAQRTFEAYCKAICNSTPPSLQDFQSQGDAAAPNAIVILCNDETELQRRQASADQVVAKFQSGGFAPVEKEVSSIVDDGSVDSNDADNNTSFECVDADEESYGGESDQFAQITPDLHATGGLIKKSPRCLGVLTCFNISISSRGLLDGGLSGFT